MWCKNYEFSQRGALCEKDRSWWQRGRGEPHKGGFTIGVHARGAQDSVCVCGTHISQRMKTMCVCVCARVHMHAEERRRTTGVHTFINVETVQACGQR